MATTPGLYLKWRACRELVGMPMPEAEIAFRLFGETKWESSAPKFSKLLYGDYGFSLDTATELAEIVNKRLDVSLRARGLPGLAEPLAPSEFTLPLYDFIRRIQSAARIEDGETLDRAQDALLGDLAPGVNPQGTVRLVIEKFAADRSFDGFLPSGGDGPVVFGIVKLLLDGQQRMTSLYGVIRGKPPKFFDGNAKAFSEAARSHWAIENGLHRTLDVTFREDDCRVRKGHGPQNFSALRKFVLTLLRQDTPYPKRSLSGRRKPADRNPNYRASLLGLPTLG